MARATKCLWLAAIALGALVSGRAAAAPVIEVSPPTLTLPPVTLGDTVKVALSIANRGDALLTVSAVDTPEGVTISQRAPYTLAPDSVLDLALNVAAIDTLPDRRAVTFHSDDPVNPTATATWENRVYGLAVETLALATSTPFPLGEPIVVESVPLDGVRVERMTLHYRAGVLDTYNTVEMTRNIRAFIGIIPGDLVLEGQLDYFVEAENSGFIAFDPVAGSERPFRAEIDSPHEFTLDALPPNAGLTWRAGDNIDFQLDLQRGTVFDTGTLWFRAGGDTAWQSVAILEQSFTGIAASIPGTVVGPAGVQYWAEVNTRTTRLTDPERAEAGPIEIRILVENLAEPIVRAAGRYRLLSLPFVPPPSTMLATVLSDEDGFGSYDPARWRAFRYLPEQGANVELSSADSVDFEVRPGRAFWLISRSEHRIDTAPAPGLSTKLDEPFSIVLAPGWNAIGNPYDFLVPWAAVRREASVGDPVAFDPAANDYVETAADTLEPFEGYFVENSSESDVTIQVYPYLRDAARTSAPRAAARPAAPATLDHGCRLEARTRDGADAANRIGVATGAAIERDARDAAKLPAPPGSRVRLAIANHGWSVRPGLYRRDIRPPAAGHTWELEVTSETAGEPIELVFHPEGDVSASTMSLVDRELGTVVDVPHAVAGSFRHTILSKGPGQIYRLAVVAGTDAYVRDAAVAGAPSRVTIDRASPNPGRDALRIRFGLPRPMAARLEVFDVTGHRVATIFDEPAASAGHHSAIWRGVRDDGGRAPSGAYYFRLTAGGESHVARAVLIR